MTCRMAASLSLRVSSLMRATSCPRSVEGVDLGQHPFIAGEFRTQPGLLRPLCASDGGDEDLPFLLAFGAGRPHRAVLGMMGGLGTPL